MGVHVQSAGCVQTLWRTPSHSQIDSCKIQNLTSTIYRRPRPSPRQGRRLGPPKVWNLLCHGMAVTLSFKASVCLPSNLSNPPNAPASLSLATLQTLRKLFHGNSRSHTLQPSVFKGVQGCRLPALKPFKPSKPSRKPFDGNSSNPSHCF